MDIWGNSEVATLVFLYIFPKEDRVVLLFPIFWWDIEVSKKRLDLFQKRLRLFLISLILFQKKSNLFFNVIFFDLLCYISPSM